MSLMSETSVFVSDMNVPFMEKMGVNINLHGEEGIKTTDEKAGSLSGPKDFFVLQMFRTMGLSDQTLLAIEEDLRN